MRSTTFFSASDETVEPLVESVESWLRDLNKTKFGITDAYVTRLGGERFTITFVVNADTYAEADYQVEKAVETLAARLGKGSPMRRGHTELLPA